MAFSISTEDLQHSHWVAGQGMTTDTTRRRCVEEILFSLVSFYPGSQADSVAESDMARSA